MYAYNTSRPELIRVATGCGLFISFGNDKGRATSFRLHQHVGTTKTSAFVPHSFDLDGSISRRKKTHVCIHGHLKFFKWLLRTNPNAEVVSGWYGRVRITTTNLDEWYEQLKDMAISPYLYNNFGLTINDACNCESHYPHLLALIEDMKVTVTDAD